MTVIYTLPDCQPCKASKRLLDREGIEYIETPIGDAERAYIASLGYSSAPVVVTPAGKHWSGFQPDNLKALKLS